ncbi:hypothetical protein GGS21DRAFT_198076 [Xylaria nigripes]|nr:hypothetical protein GGS21DRAFT_198076 [Xylaria nigripes]
MWSRLMSHYIRILVLDPAHMPQLLRATRAALFPNNAQGTSNLKPPSSTEELIALRHKCASALLRLFPRLVAELYFGTNISAWTASKTNTSIIRDEDVRAGSLQSPSSSLNHNKASIHRNSSGEISSHIPHPDESGHIMSSDAALSSQPRGHLQDPSRSTGMHLEHTNEDDARILSEIEMGIVDLFSDPYFNKHLIYGLLELILARLVPELAERGVGELWEERMV